MKISDNCLALVSKWEGSSSEAYLCPAKVWTIGYGTTKWADGSPVKQGQTITKKNRRKEEVALFQKQCIVIDETKLQENVVEGAKAFRIQSGR